MGLSIGNRLLGSTGLSNGFGLSVGNGLSFPGFGGAFSPAILFTNGEQGVWYDPSDMTTLFQDASGTTPVTAVETAVGLMLDKSKGLVLGPELVTNGDFANGTTGWTAAGGTIAVSSGEMQVTRTTGASTAYQAITTVVGATYKVTGSQRVVTPTAQPNIVARTGTDPTIGVISAGTPTTSGTFVNNTFYFIASGTTTYLHLTAGTAAGVVAFDNVTTQLISGNHATQSIDAARPVLSARVNLLTKTEQFNDAAWEKLGGGTGSVPTVTANQGTAPDGTNTADRVQFNKGAGSTSSDFSVLRAASGSRATVPSNTSIKASLRIKSNTGSPQKINVYINTFTSGGTGAGNSTITEYTATSDWQTIDITYTTSATAVAATVTAALTGVESTVNTSDVLIWGADLRVANDTAAPVYQRVNTSTDYDTTGFPMYLRFDGSDDCMIMPLAISTLNLNAWYGGRQTVAGGSGRYFFIGDSTGSINSLGGLHASVGYRWPENQSVGTGSNDISTKVISYQRPSTTSQTAYLNGVFMTPNTATTTTFTSATGRLGCRLETSAQTNFIAGQLYSLIVRGAATTETLIGQTENWISGKMGGGYYPTGFDFLVDANGNQLTDESGNPLIAQALYS